MNVSLINILLVLTSAIGIFLPYIRIKEVKFDYKTVLFGTGLLIAMVSILIPSGPSGEGSLFSIHMAKHVLLLMVAPPLMMAGLSEKHVQPFVSLSGSGRFIKKLTHPIAAWVFGVGIMWFWHAPPIYNGMMTIESGWIQSALMTVEILSLIMIGLIFCSPILLPIDEYRLPALPGIAYLFTACVACSVLGILITFSSAGLYTTVFTEGTGHVWGLNQSTDQQLGGLIMWVPGCIIYVSGTIMLLTRWYSGKEPSYQRQSNQATTI